MSATRERLRFKRVHDEEDARESARGAKSRPRCIVVVYAVINSARGQAGPGSLVRRRCSNPAAVAIDVDAPDALTHCRTHERMVTRARAARVAASAARTAPAPSPAARTAPAPSDNDLLRLMQRDIQALSLRVVELTRELRADRMARAKTRAARRVRS